MLEVFAALRASSLISSVNSAFDLLLFPELGMIDQSGPLPLNGILCFVFTEFTAPKAEIPISPPHNSFSYLRFLFHSKPLLLPAEMPRERGADAA